jgi:putative two-component system response regulator
MDRSSQMHAENILIVDDDSAIREMLQRGLHLFGYKCQVADGAASAIEILDHDAVDVVVADIRMPDMSGIELCQIIKHRYQADVIVMTGYVEDFNYEDIVQQGASDFIQKPIRIAEFIARLKRVLAEREGRAELKTALTDVQFNLDKFQRAMEGFVQAISVAVEKRDPYTAGHQQRVAELACAMAEDMGLEQDEIYGLRMASVIHDLGKITVPAGILSKPGKLSNLEYELIKSHVQAGYDILKQIEFPWPLADVILQHHERLNGSGYPQGLTEGDIMLQARILAVADVFETIASHRPYRPSLGLDHAIDELNRNSGVLYDPAVVGSCLRIIKQERFQSYQ